MHGSSGSTQLKGPSQKIRRTQGGQSSGRTDSMQMREMVKGRGRGRGRIKNNGCFQSDSINNTQKSEKDNMQCANQGKASEETKPVKKSNAPKYLNTTRIRQMTGQAPRQTYRQESRYKLNNNYSCSASIKNTEANPTTKYKYVRDSKPSMPLDNYIYTKLQETGFNNPFYDVGASFNNADLHFNFDTDLEKDENPNPNEREPPNDSINTCDGGINLNPATETDNKVDNKLTEEVPSGKTDKCVDENIKDTIGETTRPSLKCEDDSIIQCVEADLVIQNKVHSPDKEKNIEQNEEIGYDVIDYLKLPPNILSEDRQPGDAIKDKNYNSKENNKFNEKSNSNEIKIGINKDILQDDSGIDLQRKQSSEDAEKGDMDIEVASECKEEPHYRSTFARFSLNDNKSEETLSGNSTDEGWSEPSDSDDCYTSSDPEAIKDESDTSGSDDVEQRKPRKGSHPKEGDYSSDSSEHFDMPSKNIHRRRRVSINSSSEEQSSSITLSASDKDISDHERSISSNKDSSTEDERYTSEKDSSTSHHNNSNLEKEVKQLWRKSDDKSSNNDVQNEKINYETPLPRYKGNKPPSKCIYNWRTNQIESVNPANRGRNRQTNQNTTDRTSEYPKRRVLLPTPNTEYNPRRPRSVKIARRNFKNDYNENFPSLIVGNPESRELINTSPPRWKFNSKPKEENKNVSVIYAGKNKDAKNSPTKDIKVVEKSKEKIKEVTLTEENQKNEEKNVVLLSRAETLPKDSSDTELKLIGNDATAGSLRETENNAKIVNQEKNDSEEKEDEQSKESTIKKTVCTESMEDNYEQNIYNLLNDMDIVESSSTDDNPPVPLRTERKSGLNPLVPEGKPVSTDLQIIENNSKEKEYRFRVKDDILMMEVLSIQNDVTSITERITNTYGIFKSHWSPTEEDIWFHKDVSRLLDEYDQEVEILNVDKMPTSLTKKCCCTHDCYFNVGKRLIV